MSLTNGITPLVSIKEITTEDQTGNFEVAMTVYEDSEFKEVAPKDYSIKVNEKIFIGIALSVDTIVLEAEQCWATPRLRN